MQLREAKRRRAINERLDQLRVFIIEIGVNQQGKGEVLRQYPRALRLVPHGHAVVQQGFDRVAATD